MRIRNYNTSKYKKANSQYWKLWVFLLVFLLGTVLVIYFSLTANDATTSEREKINFMAAKQQARIAALRKFTLPKPKSFKGHKIVHFDLKGAPPKISYYEFLFPLIAEQGATGVLMEYEDMFPYKNSVVNASAKNRYSDEDIRKINLLGKQNNLEVIPLVRTFGHLSFVLKLKEFIELREVPTFPSAICPSNKKSISIITEMLTQVIKAHPNSKFFHIGMDEVFYMGICGKCQARMQNEHIKKKQLFLDHLNVVIKLVHKINPNLKILLWDDVLRTFKNEELKEIPNDVTPIIWHYQKDVFDVVDPLTEIYSGVFENVWFGSSYKGALGSNNYAPDLSYYVANNEAWFNYVTDRGNALNFTGGVLTGWQRYDHFAILCELLPVSIPTLIINLRLLKGMRDNQFLPTEVAETLNCTTPYGLVGLGIPRCNYTGGKLLEYVHRLQELEHEFKALEGESGTLGWMNDFNVHYNFSNPQIVMSNTATLNEIDKELRELRGLILKELKIIYDNYTVHEWEETFITPFRGKINDMRYKKNRLLWKTYWPRRPFN